jgi:lipopolysaccharide export system protein LptA
MQEVFPNATLSSINRESGLLIIVNKTYICLFFLILSLPFSILAQSRVELIHADVSRGMRIGNEEVSVLEGNVYIRQDTMAIYCDVAKYFKSQNKVVLEKNVRIIRGKQVLTALKVTYFEKTKVAIAESNVNVRRPGQELSCDYLRYFYETDQSYARGNVKIIDRKNRTTITSREGEYLPDRSISKVWHDAHFMQADSNSIDTLHIYAEKMTYFFDSPRKATAVGSVVILKGDLEAHCDSAVYLIDEEKVFLEKNPVAKQQNNELSGEQIELLLPDMKLERIFVRRNALTVSVVDSARQQINRLSGKEIMAIMKDDEIDQLWAYNNARSQYYLEDERVVQGVNNASADTIKVFFKDGEVEYIEVIGGAEGVYKPENNVGKR